MAPKTSPRNRRIRSSAGKLQANKETIRDLTPRRAGSVKAAGKQSVGSLDPVNCQAGCAVKL
jgi:hypothetical protein